MYAIWSKDRRVLGAVLLLQLIPIGINIVRIYFCAAPTRFNHLPINYTVRCHSFTSQGWPLSLLLLPCSVVPTRYISQRDSLRCAAHVFHCHITILIQLALGVSHGRAIHQNTSASISSLKRYAAVGTINCACSIIVAVLVLVLTCLKTAKLKWSVPTLSQSEVEKLRGPRRILRTILPSKGLPCVTLIQRDSTLL